VHAGGIEWYNVVMFKILKFILIDTYLYHESDHNIPYGMRYLLNSWYKSNIQIGYKYIYNNDDYNE